MRAAAIQLNSTADVGRNLEAAERLVRAAAADGAELARAAREVERCWPPARCCAELAEPLDGPIDRGLPRLGARARRSICSPAASPSGSPGRELIANTSLLIDPEGEIAADLPQDPHVRRRRRRGRLPRVRARAGRRRDRRPRDAGGEPAARADRLLRPPLSRALPDPRPARRRARSPSPPPSPPPPGATTGRSCCAPGRSRTSSS